MKLSIVIIGYNSWHFLEKNLASLSFLKNDTETEIIYVDNASNDKTVTEMERLYPAVRIFRNTKNLGISKARNRGIREATGKYIWLLDSDTEVSAEAANGMLTFMDNHPEAGICGCKMYGQDGKVQPSCRKFPTISGKLKTAIHIVAGKFGCGLYTSFVRSNHYDTEVEMPFEVDYLIGACQLIRKEAQERVGELDEKIFYGPEDADFCLRMKFAGYKVFYIPQVSIYHAYQRVTSHQLFSKLTRKHLQGLVYYFWKKSKRLPKSLRQPS